MGYGLYQDQLKLHAQSEIRNFLLTLLLVCHVFQLNPLSMNKYQKNKVIKNPVNSKDWYGLSRGSCIYGRKPSLF